MGIDWSPRMQIVCLSKLPETKGFFPLFVWRISAVVPSPQHVDKAGESQAIWIENISISNPKREKHYHLESFRAIAATWAFKCSHSPKSQVVTCRSMSRHKLAHYCFISQCQLQKLNHSKRKNHPPLHLLYQYYATSSKFSWNQWTERIPMALASLRVCSTASSCFWAPAFDITGTAHYCESESAMLLRLLLVLTVYRVIQSTPRSIVSEHHFEVVKARLTSFATTNTHRALLEDIPAQQR